MTSFSISEGDAPGKTVTTLTISKLILGNASRFIFTAVKPPIRMTKKVRRFTNILLERKNSTSDFIFYVFLILV
ncbi:hypothetical protein LEP1GSC088_1403 [Leptospira interrogans str. L1207]|nr:hypothetical protein LEP1GSC088_1403 [Leptospira interrogans str. L1207]